MKSTFVLIGVFALAVSIHIYFNQTHQQKSDHFSINFFRMLLCVQIIASDCSITELTAELRLDDMDNYSLMRFFNRLQFDELLNLAEINARFRHLIGHYMLAKYSIHKKILRLRNVENAAITNTAINIGKCATALRFLRHFGHLITKLEYTNKQHNFIENLEINHSIQRFCARTLVEIKLSSVQCYLIGDVNNTFEKVTNVDFSSDSFPRDNLQLHRIYPRMERLNFSIPNPMTITMTSLAQTYSNLKHLEFYEYDGDSHLRRIIRANLQLRSLKLNMCPTIELLRFLDENLPHLESLAVPCCEFGANSSVFMKNVKKFMVTINGLETDSVSPFPVTFNQLESLDLWITTTIANVPIKLIEQNIGIKVLSLQWIESIETYSHVIDTFVKPLAELNDLHITWSNSINVTETLHLFDQINQLKVKTITFIMTNRTFCDDLIKLKPNQWQFSDEQSTSSVKYITFVRNVDL